jgi:hypothetical protein
MSAGGYGCVLVDLNPLLGSNLSMLRDMFRIHGPNMFRRHINSESTRSVRIVKRAAHLSCRAYIDLFMTASHQLTYVRFKFPRAASSLGGYESPWCLSLWSQTAWGTRKLYIRYKNRASRNINAIEE